MTSYRYFVCSPFYFWHYITVCLFSHHLAFAFPLGNIVDVLCSTFGGHIQWHEDDHVFSFSFRTYNLLYTKICGMSRKSSYTHAHAHTKWTFNFRFVYLWRARGWHHIIDISCIETLLYSMISLYYLYCIDWYIPVDQIKVVQLFIFYSSQLVVSLPFSNIAWILNNRSTRWRARRSHFSYFCLRIPSKSFLWHNQIAV